MKAPTQKQLNDPAWWDENAPDWAASVITNDSRNDFNWFRYVKGHGAAEDIFTGSRFVADTTGSAHRWKIFPRPLAKPEPQEWDGELPPAGSECEIDVESSARWFAGDKWRSCEVLAHRGGRAICWVPSCNRVIDSGECRHFRPIRTKEQREREEIVRQAAHAIEMKNGSPITLYIKYCEDLYDAGLLRKGE